METFRDITIERDSNVKRFRVGLITAQEGCWILAQRDSGLAADEEVFRKIQGIFFGACQYIKETPGAPDIPVALYDRSKQRWLLADMERDLMAVQELQEEALDFNLGPYLKKREERLKKLRAAVEAAKAAS